MIEVVWGISVYRPAGDTTFFARAARNAGEGISAYRPAGDTAFLPREARLFLGERAILRSKPRRAYPERDSAARADVAAQSAANGARTPYVHRRPTKKNKFDLLPSISN